MLSDTVISVGGHTLNVSSVGLLVAGVSLLALAAFLLALSRGRRVVVQRSATTDDLAIQLARIAEALERIANRPADRLIAEAWRGEEQAAAPKVGEQAHSILGR
jgi:hypothetical protein